MSNIKLRDWGRLVLDLTECQDLLTRTQDYDPQGSAKLFISVHAGILGCLFFIFEATLAIFVTDALYTSCQHLCSHANL